MYERTLPKEGCSSLLLVSEAENSADASGENQINRDTKTKIFWNFDKDRYDESLFIGLYCLHHIRWPLDKTIRRKRSRKSFLPDQRQSESQLDLSSPVVYVSSMVDLQPPVVKSSPKSDLEHDNNPLLISDDDNQEFTKKSTMTGGGEDECAVDGGACMKPSGSSIKCQSSFQCAEWNTLLLFRRGLLWCVRTMVSSGLCGFNKREEEGRIQMYQM